MSIDKKELLFIYYFLCKIHNKFINNAKIDLIIYLNFTNISNFFINTLTSLGITIIFYIIIQYKIIISNDHTKIIDYILAEYKEKT